MSISLKEKRIVLLGGTAGIGFATAEAAANEGAALVVVSSQQERVDRAIAALPKGTEGYAVDLSSEEQIGSFFDRVGAFDHLVFTAGETLQLGALESVDLGNAQQFFKLRFWGAMAAAKYGSRNIRPNGSIVLTSGIACLRPQKGWSLGASLCGAMESFTRALAVELAPIRVNIVSPGFVRTDLWSNMAEADRNAMYQQVGETLPVGRVGEAQDIAQTYLYLMREGFSTGQVIVVDGGAVLV